MKYTLKRIADPDYGCEEVPEGAEIKCALLLIPEGAKDSSQFFYREIPDRAASEFGLRPGMTLSDADLDALAAGQAPSGWNRS